MYGMDGRAVEGTLPAICTPICVMDLEEEAEHCSTNMIALLFLHGTGTDTRGGEAVLICLFDCVFFCFAPRWETRSSDGESKRARQSGRPAASANFCTTRYLILLYDYLTTLLLLLLDTEQCSLRTVYNIFRINFPLPFC